MPSFLRARSWQASLAALALASVAARRATRRPFGLPVGAAGSGVLGAAVLCALAACGARTTLREAPPAEPGGSCSAASSCASPLSCCGDSCVDPSIDPAHCGACDLACPAPPHADPACALGACGVGACEPGFADCNQLPADGCEVATTGSCGCAPGDTQPCYDGPVGTEGVAACRGGLRTCSPGAAWGPCEGQVLPSPEACNGADDDCDGVADFADSDGDGWTACVGDCCELPGECATAPGLVNPGAFEVEGNGADDDCDGALDVPAATCDPDVLHVPTTADELARAMDLCRFTVEEPPLPEKTWGVLSAALTLADGAAGPPDDVQAGVLAAFGSQVAPKKSATMVALSSGTARAEGDPGYVHPQNGGPGQSGNYVTDQSSGVPTAWLAGNGGIQPTVSCPPCSGVWCTQGHDPVDLRLTVRVPTNAASFTFWHKFHTAEYPEFGCNPGPDRFVALLQGAAPTCGPTPTIGCIPPDTNIAFDSLGHPVSSNDAWFEVCFPAAGAPPGACPLGHFELVGNGFGGWNGAVTDGAATAWLEAAGPVVPGETITLELAIWDGMDHNVDSLVLVDGFEWHVTRVR